MTQLDPISLEILWNRLIATGMSRDWSWARLAA